MNRLLEAEWLDELPANDVRACRSRQDLRALNWWMGHPRIAARELRALERFRVPRQVMDIGGGDGTFLLAVARQLGQAWSGTQATILDRQKLLGPQTTRAFEELGWNAQAVTEDVLNWCTAPAAANPAIVLVNLFLHHFETKPLKLLLGGIAQKSSALIALEPRRSKWSLFFSNLVGIIGCNAVTRHDAPASVRAGFVCHELCELWPEHKGWIINEAEVGVFSHLFVARRTADVTR